MMTEGEQQQQQQQMGSCDDDLDDKMHRNPELFSAQPLRQRRTFCYNWSAGFGAPFVATSPATIASILDTVVIRPTDIVADLGCGDGSLLIQVAEATSAASLVGVELDVQLVKQAAEAAAQRQLQHRLSFVCADITELDLTGYSVIFIYMLPALLSKLSHKLVSHLLSQPDALLISITWPLQLSSQQQGTDLDLLLFTYKPAASAVTGTHVQGAASGFHVYGQNKSRLKLLLPADNGSRQAVL